MKQFSSDWVKYNIIYERFAEQHGLTIVELYVYMGFEAANYQPTLTQLVTYSGHPKQTIFSLMTKMKAANLVESVVDKTDKRRKFLVLTQKGRQLVDAVLKDLHEKEQAAILVFGRENLDELNRLNGLFLTALDNHF